MARHIALLRGINVGGNQMIAMVDLRALFGKLALGDAQSLLQSGNIVFKSKRTTAQLESLLESEVAKRLGVTTTFYVRTAREWKSIVADNPFPAAAKKDPSHLVALFLKKPPTPAAIQALKSAIVGKEEVQAAGRQVYVIYPDGIGRSRLTPAIIDAKLGQRGTGRNWNTLLKLAALAAA